MPRRYTARFSRRTMTKSRPTFPDRNFVKFHVARNDVDLSLSSGTPGITRRFFDLYPNSLYEVDKFDGKVPLNYNVYLGAEDGPQPYHRYMVYGAKIDWTLHCSGNNQLRAATLVWDSQDWSPDPLWDFTDYAEQKDRCRVYQIGSIQSGDSGLYRGSTYIGMSKIFNMSKSDFFNPGNESDYSGYFNTSPVNYCQFRLIVEKLNPTVSANIPVSCDYVITFYTMLYDRNQNVFEVKPAPPLGELKESQIEMLPDDPDPEQIELDKTEILPPAPTYEELLKLYHNTSS